MADNLPFYSPNLKPGIPRKRAPGLEVWRLRCGDRIQTCELRDDSRVGAGRDVQLLEDGEPLFSRRNASNLTGPRPLPSLARK